MARSGKSKDLSLTQTLGRFLTQRLVPDLRTRVETSLSVKRALDLALDRERADGRTADDPLAWRARMLEQVGAAWLLSTVFVRYLEDHDLVDHRRVAGDGAEDAQERFGAAFPGLAGNAREYLLAVFRECARLPGAREVLGPRNNPAYQLGPSTEVAGELLGIFRERTAEGALVWRLDGDDTRVLGDLYQDLSAGVRERYALLQTPDFVEAFILARTLDPAVREFGLGTVNLIDPTCGSGHFLLGAFERLRAMRQKAAPAGTPGQWALDALQHVWGVDLNPYAVAITRFRLLIAFVRAAGLHRLSEAPDDLALSRHVVVADSLLYRREGQRHLAESVKDEATRRALVGGLFELEDPIAAKALFAGKFHAVVGNPPYITCKDAALRKTYREIYPESAQMQFAMGAPFTERFFELPVAGGFVGLINANSFLKREFGKGLIEKVLRRVDLTHVIDTSGAFIPGHGTPTVILFGRHQRPAANTVRAVMGKRGEPETPEDAAKGKVWSGIVAGIDHPGYEDEFVSVAEVARTTFDKHPWSLGGGGAGELKELIEQRCEQRLQALVETIGRTNVVGEDDVWIAPPGSWQRNGTDAVVPFVLGECVRDWSIQNAPDVLLPYNSLGGGVVDPRHPLVRLLWPWRALLEQRTIFGKQVKQSGRRWWEHLEYYRDRFRTPLSIAFAFVATHNHFVLDRGGKVFKQTAPIIKLPASATEDDHLALLAWLNSSVAAFLLRQSCSSKGSQGINEGIKTEMWEQFLEYSGGNVERLAVALSPASAGIAQAIASLAVARAEKMPAAALAAYESDSDDGAIQPYLADARYRAEAFLADMVTRQEDLDWHWYETLGLLTDEERARHDAAREAVAAESPSPALPTNCGEGAFPHPGPPPMAGEGSPEDVRGRGREGSAASLRRTLPRLRGRAWVGAGTLPTICGEGRGGVFAGHRAFEVVLHRSGQDTQWFARNGYALPTEEALGVYSPAQRELLNVRISILQANKSIGLIERPEYKRRWTHRDFDAEARDAARTLLLDLAETFLRGAERPVTAREVVSALVANRTAQALATVAIPNVDDPIQALPDLLADDAVPFLATMRFTDSGQEKRTLWEATWVLQRREDAGEKLTITVPPKYDREDYADTRYWSLRGRLDVPRERFISYPSATTDDDPSPLYGWAGWDTKQRADALAALYQRRKQDDGWTAERLAPLLAGLDELVPWLQQWNNSPAPGDDQGAGDAYGAYVAGEARELGVTREQLRGWRPPTKAEARRAKSPRGPATAALLPDEGSAPPKKRGRSKKVTGDET